MIRRFFAWLGFLNRDGVMSAAWLQQQAHGADKQGIDQSCIRWDIMRARR